MAVITQDTFDPLKAWISVRLQQGVPIVDADWNEADDVRRFELRAYLKWFVGDGVPEGNDGFRIDAVDPAVNDNFKILGNDVPVPLGATNYDKALRYAGRCIVDGLDVIIASDTTFMEQKLHPSQPNADALAIAWGVPKIDLLPLASNVATVAVYLDVWERLVTPTEEPSMKLPALGIESCARRKREWVVRVAIDGKAPEPSLPGHSHYLLATITRPNSVPTNIQPSHITDRREKRILMPPATLIEDTVGGTAADYRQGFGRPLISLRDAINCLNRGEHPGMPMVQVPPVAGYIVWYPEAVLERPDSAIISWTAVDPGVGGNRVALSRIKLSDPAATITPPVMFGPPNPAKSANVPSTVVLPNGQIVVAFEYEPPNAPYYDVAFRRVADLAGLPNAADRVLFNTSNQWDSDPVAILSGPYVVFFALAGSGQQLQYKRYNHAADQIVDNAGQVVSGNGVTVSYFHAATDASGKIWGAYTTNAGAVNMFRLNPVTKVIDATFSVSAAQEYFYPFVQIVGDETWVFWQSVTEGIRLARYDGGWSHVGLIPFTEPDDTVASCAQLEDGRILVVFARKYNVFASIVNPATREWSPPMAISAGQTFSLYPNIVASPSDVLAVWMRQDGANGYQLAHKRLAIPL